MASFIPRRLDRGAPKSVCGLLQHLAVIVWIHFFNTVNPHRVMTVREAGSQKLRGRPRNFCDPASSNHHNSGGVHRGKKGESIQSQLSALATRTPILGCLGQGASVKAPGYKACHKLGSAIFSDPCVFGYIF